jgi:DNA polymerase I-like protein with 3'-5' exonuclease and polymerase domains
VETTAAPGWEKYEEAALDFNRNRISVYAVASVHGGYVSRSLSELSDARSLKLGGHNFKFDLKTLMANGAPLGLENYGDDSMLMGVALTHKVPDSYVADYAAKRKELNEKAGHALHRKAGKYSLKVMAPYFLGIEPFWEVADHNDDEYVAKDAVYTAQLIEALARELKSSGGYDFYKEMLLPWNKMLLEAEYEGVHLDVDLLSVFEAEYAAKALSSEKALKEIWAPQFEAYGEERRAVTRAGYFEKRAAAIAKIAPSKKKDPVLAAAEVLEKEDKIRLRYAEMYSKAAAKIEPLSLASPTQLKWLLKESLGLDVTTFDGEDESTGKAVLERLAGQGVPGVTELLAYRQASKLTTAFFPSYREMAFEGRIHCGFNLNGTRTGRLSSSSPNLQQISKKIMPLFKARDGYSFVYRDVSAIEPRLIAYATECKKLCDIFLKGTDFHSENVRTMLGIQEEDVVIKGKYKAERDLVKEVGLALMYGAGAGRIEECAAKRGFKWTYKECKEKYKRFQYEYAEVWAYKEALEERIRSGELIENVLGRPLTFDPERLHMQSLNSYTQSAGSDVLLESVRRTRERAAGLGLECQPLLFIIRRKRFTICSER